MPSDFVLFPEDEQWGDFPDDFLGDEPDEHIFDDLREVRAGVGSPLRPLITDFETIQSRNQAHQMRAVRFTTGAEALIWLFRRGIFLFSNVVRFEDGTWGVRIGSSDSPPDAGGEGDTGSDDIIF